MSDSHEHDDALTAPVGTENRANLPFTVVGIGASAGGLAALQEFFQNVAADSGIAYVVIQHLSPDHTSQLDDILSRNARIPVKRIVDGMTIKPNIAYVIAPGFTLRLEHGALHFSEPVEQRGHRRPVDDFFKSLASEQNEKAIAVVLSGTGTNGTAGAQAIKAAGGVCIAQQPESAAFPGMPQSLINAGYADQVLEPRDMPALIRRYANFPGGRTTADWSDDEEDQQRDRSQLREILAVLRTRTRHDFTGYRKATLKRRIQRRMGLIDVHTLEDYARLLRENPAETAALASDLMINVTGFFRDPEAWDALRTMAIAPVVARRQDGQPIRCWTSACATGEEAYTLAILIAEELEGATHIDVKIFATDTSERSLAHARAGVYPGGIEADMTPERLERFFDKEEHTYRVKKEIRDMVVFAPQDILRDPPFSRIDICSCRNLLIYLEPETQRRVMSLMHFALREGGYLFLGNTESFSDSEHLFEAVSKKWRIFRRTGVAQTRFSEINTPATRRPDDQVRNFDNLHSFEGSRPSATLVIQRILLEKYGPPTVVIDRADPIVYFHGATGEFLELPAGEPTREMFQLLRGPLRTAARAALRTAMKDNVTVSVETPLNDGGDQLVEITVAPLIHGKAPEYYRVSFALPPVARLASGEVVVHEIAPSDGAAGEERRLLRLELQSATEAYEATNEELKAAHEEATSMNEELQSANEELETGKEELQAINEELTTVNAQLQAKIQQLEAHTNDIANLLSSTDVAVLFLDTDFRVRRFTPAVTELFELIETDIGRPVTNLAQKFADDNLLSDARSTLQTLMPTQREIRSDRGHWFMRRTLPYRTEESRIEGVVLTFIDIGVHKRAENEVMKAHKRVQGVLEQMPTAVVIVEPKTARLRYANRKASRLFGDSIPYPVPADYVAPFRPIMGGADAGGLAYEADRWPLARSVATGEIVDDEIIEVVGPGNSKIILSVSSAPVRDSVGEPTAIVGTFHDITQRRRFEQEVLSARESNDRAHAAEHANRTKDEFIAVVSHELRTPLNTIRLCTRMLSKDNLPTKDRNEGIQMINRAAIAQQRLIDDLLDVSRIVSGKLKLTLRDVAVTDVIRGAAESVEPVAAARGLTLKVHVADDAGLVQADVGRLQQVLLNLLSNAVKFTPQDGIITLAARRSGAQVIIEVTDTGVGIKPEFLPNVFDRFRQAEGSTSRTNGGLGLGLAISREIIGLHGGKIFARSDGPGKGSTFCIELPGIAAEQAELGAPDGDSSLRGVDVLLVEDESATRTVMKKLLESHGAHVRAVDNVADARDAINERAPRLVVTDIGLPGEDGYALIRFLRDLDNGERTAALAVTAFAGPEDRQRALKAGFDEHLAKPVDPDRLIVVAAQLAARTLN